MWSISPLHFFYSSYTAWSAQKLGASAMIIISISATLDYVVIPPQVDIKRGEVWGELITIPVVSVLKSNMMASVAQAASRMDVSSIVPDDTGNTAFYTVFSIPYCVSLCFSAYFLCLAIFIVRHLLSHQFLQVQPTQTVKQRNVRQCIPTRVSSLRYVILYSELLHSIVRVIFFVDYFGLFHVIGNHFNQDMIGYLAFQLSTFNNVVTVLYCYDVYRLINQGRKLKKTQSLFTRHRWLIPAIVGFTSFMVLSRVAMEYLILIGIIGAAGNVGGDIYNIAGIFAVITATINLNRHAKKELADIMLSAPQQLPIAKLKPTLTRVAVEGETPSISSSVTLRPTSTAHDVVRLKMMHFDRTRRYMVKSLIGISIDGMQYVFWLALLLTGSQWIAFVLVPLQVGPIVSSYYEVLAAVDYAAIPPSTVAEAHTTKRLTAKARTNTHGLLSGVSEGKSARTQDGKHEGSQTIVIKRITM